MGKKKKNKIPGGVWRLERDGKLPEIDPLKRLGTRQPFKPVDFGESRPSNLRSADKQLRAVSIRKLRNYLK